MMHIIESPRDAMQGYGPFIPSAEKARYLNQILQANFDIVDIGSFVSPRAIPQLRDTEEVYHSLDLRSSKSKLMAIVANERGARAAANLSEITYIGLPLSTSEEFLRRNINTNRTNSLKRADAIKNICEQKGKKLILYISMAFGNPYGEEWSFDDLMKGSQQFIELGIDFINYSDTIGIGRPEQISAVFRESKILWPDIRFGLHLHMRNNQWKPHIEAAWNEGCRWYDGVLSGLGGCPMTGHGLIGNLPTKNLIDFAEEGHIDHQINTNALIGIEKIEKEIFSTHGITPLETE